MPLLIKKRSTIPWSSWLLDKEFESEAEEDGEQGEAKRETDLLSICNFAILFVMMIMISKLDAPRGQPGFFFCDGDEFGLD